MKVIRTDDEAGTEEVVFSGFVEVQGVKDGMAQLRAMAPAVALKEMPLPWAPPGMFQRQDRPGLEHWWRQIHYVFDLPNPRMFPALPPDLLEQDERRLLSRFVHITEDLAASQMLSFDAGFTVGFDDETNEPFINGADLPGRDIQSGFAVLVRQCLSPNDPANFDAVAITLKAAMTRADDPRSDERQRELASWTDAVERLREQFLEQLLRDRLVREERWSVFDYQRDGTPAELLRTVNYGDLIHWGSTRERVIARTDDEVAALRQRMDYFEAAAGLAHVLSGFGLLVRAATAPPGEVFIP